MLLCCTFAMASIRPMQGRRNDFGMGGGGQKSRARFFNHTYISKGYNFEHYYIYDFQYPLSYEHILALFLYTDLNVVVLYS